jgi:hypothetical protein
MKNSIQPINVVQMDIETKVQVAQDIGQVLSGFNIREAVTHNGDRYKHDLATGAQVVVTKGTSITVRENTITVVLQRPGASLDGTLAETISMTQQLQGALTGVHQSTVSRRLAKRKKTS